MTRLLFITSATLAAFVLAGCAAVPLETGPMYAYELQKDSASIAVGKPTDSVHVYIQEIDGLAIRSQPVPNGSELYVSPGEHALKVVFAEDGGAWGAGMAPEMTNVGASGDISATFVANHKYRLSGGVGEGATKDFLHVPHRYKYFVLELWDDSSSSACWVARWTMPAVGYLESAEPDEPDLSSQ